MIKKISAVLVDEENKKVTPSRKRGISEAAFSESMENLIESINDKIEQINKEFKLLKKEYRELKETFENHIGEICHYL